MCLFLFAQLLQDAGFVIIEVILLCSREFAFTQMWWVCVALFYPDECLIVFFTRDQFLCQFQAGYLILCGNFSLTAFPRMEFSLIDPADGFPVLSGLVQQGDIFEL